VKCLGITNEILIILSRCQIWGFRLGRTRDGSIEKRLPNSKKFYMPLKLFFETYDSCIKGVIMSTKVKKDPQQTETQSETASASSNEDTANLGLKELRDFRRDNKTQ